MATVGQALTGPESGWQRIEETNSGMSFLGTWVDYTAAGISGYLKYSNTVNDMILFDFTGTRLRIIGYMSSNRSTNVSICIDGVYYYYNQYNASAIAQALVFESPVLTDTEHCVIIRGTDTGFFDLDAVDINTTASIKSYNSKINLSYLGLVPKTDLSTMEIGDFISCKYVATSGVLGVLSSFGTDGEISNAIPQMTSPTTPSGIATSSSNYDGNYVAWMAFNRNQATNYGWLSNNIPTAWLKYQFPSAMTIIKYTIKGYAASQANMTYMPKAWTFEGSNNDVNWTVLDTQTNQTGWLQSEKRSYSFSNSTSYLYYRLNITQSNATWVGLDEMEMFDSTPVRMAEIPMNASATPNGIFNFIKVDKGLLIADRVIQHSISWDTINSGGLIEGKNIATDLCNGGTITASPNENVSYGKAKAFDNLLNVGSDMWWATDLPAWIQYNFTSAVVVNSISMLGYTNSSYDPKDIDVLGSNDGTNYTLLYTNASLPHLNGGWVTVYFNNTTSYSQYKIYIRSVYSETALLLTEIEMKYDLNLIIRSLSGGVAYRGANPYTFNTTDLGFGAFPDSNEWDSHIRNNDLDGKITKGNQNVWNWCHLSSWTKNTPITALGVVSTRVHRGKNSEKYFALVGSGTANNSIGFRPVLEYKEDKSIIWY